VTAGETRLEMAQRHVRTGHDCIARQRDLIRRMDPGHPLLPHAIKLLRLTSLIQQLSIDHCRRLERAEDAQRSTAR
jgi:hypothetical protein